MYQNLHCHTHLSDGQMTHQQVLDICQRYDISMVAFTDHDTLPDKKALKILEKNRSHFTKWIIGCEISSGWPKEIGGPTSNFHIVGLFVDSHNRKLSEHCQKAKEARIERMERMVKNLQALGFKISKEGCLKESEGETIGRPHIVAALKKNESNLRIIEVLRKKMQREAENNPEIRKEYEKMMARGPEQYPYSLFLNPDAFLPDIYVDYLYWKDMDESVRLIRDAGGVAFLAHWSFSKHKVNEEMVKKFFQNKRLDGAEVVFGADRIINLKDEEIKKDMETMEKIAKDCGVLRSGGLDSHTPKDFEVFLKENWFAEKTKGLIQKMMDSRKLSLKFSSLRDPTS